MNNNPASELRESKISDYVNIMSESDTVKALLNTQTTPGQPSQVSQQKQLDAAYAISDMFQSIAREGMTVSEILKFMYKNHSKHVNTVAEGIKIIHSFKDYNIGQDQTLHDSPFVIKDIKESEKVASMNDIIPHATINSLPDNPSRLNPSLVSILHNDPKFRCGVRNSLELSAFWNLLSNIELSKMYPYLNVNFKLPRLLKKNNQIFSTATVNQFLNGTIRNSTTETYRIFEAGFAKEQTPVTGDDKGETTIIAGTDANFSIFTMPQTLNNFNEKFVGHIENFGKINTRATTIHDVTRPFLTIQSFDIDVAASQGLLSFKSGRISMILHDRTRMTDIAPFVKPDLFGSFGAEVIVEYGWSHMDAGDKENKISQFLNKSRVIEKYIITNSSFSIQKDGSVKIDIGIAMRGPLDIRQVLIKREADTEIVTSPMKTTISGFENFSPSSNPQPLMYLGSDKIFNVGVELNVDFKAQLFKIAESGQIDKNVKKTTDLITPTANKSEYQQIKDSFGTNLKDTLRILNDLVKNKIITLAAKPNLNDALLFLTNPDNKSSNNSNSLDQYYLGFLYNWLREIAAFLNKLGEELLRINVITKKNKIKVDEAISKIIPLQEKDGFIDESILLFLNNNKNKIYENIPGKNIKKDKSNKLKTLKTSDYISFGNFISSLVGTHLTNTGKYDEIQLIFYTANSYSAAMSSRNISSFLINKKDLQSFLKDLFKDNLQFTLESIINAVIKNFISVRSQPCYGFSSLFESKSDSNGKKTPVNSAAKELDNNIDIILKNIYQIQTDNTDNDYEIEFKMPRIGLSFDTLTNKKDGYNTTICKISVFDRNDNPFSSLNSITKNIQSNSGILKLNKQLALLRKANNANASKSNQSAFFKEASRLIKSFQRTGYIDIKGNEITINNQKNGISSLKSGFKKFMPSMTYGTQNSGIISANVTTVNDGALNTLFLTRPDRNDIDGRYAVKFKDPLPLRILPTQATVEVWGCPFVNFAQYIFLDFETGTTLDNIYSVASIKHSITPGSFKTTLTLSYGDIYGKYETAAKNISDIKKNQQAAQQKASEAREAEEQKAEKTRQQESLEKASNQQDLPPPGDNASTNSDTDDDPPEWASDEIGDEPKEENEAEEAQKTPAKTKKSGKKKKTSLSFPVEVLFEFNKNKITFPSYVGVAGENSVRIKFNFNFKIFKQSIENKSKNRINVKKGTSIESKKPANENNIAKYVEQIKNIGFRIEKNINNKKADEEQSYVSSFYLEDIKFGNSEAYYVLNFGTNDQSDNRLSILRVAKEFKTLISIPIFRNNNKGIWFHLPVYIDTGFYKKFFNIKKIPITCMFKTKNNKIISNSISYRYTDMNIINNLEIIENVDKYEFDYSKEIKPLVERFTLDKDSFSIPEFIDTFTYEIIKVNKNDVYSDEANKGSRANLVCTYKFKDDANGQIEFDETCNKISNSIVLKNMHSVINILDETVSEKITSKKANTEEYFNEWINGTYAVNYDKISEDDTDIYDYYNLNSTANTYFCYYKNTKEKTLSISIDLNFLINFYLKSTLFIPINSNES